MMDTYAGYKEGDDLPTLYSHVQKVLKLSPADQTEDRFRAILGACTTVVKELGSVRNRHSDAHGSGRRSYRVAGRHAALAVNLAGSMALFLIETQEARQEHTCALCGSCKGAGPAVHVPKTVPTEPSERRNPLQSGGFHEYRYGDSNPGFRRERAAS
jgi:hypothetical protein